MMKVEDVRRTTQEAKDKYAVQVEQESQEALRALEKEIVNAAKMREEKITFTEKTTTFSHDACVYALNTLKENGFKTDWKIKRYGPGNENGYWYLVSWS